MLNLGCSFLTPELTPIFAGTYFPKPTFLDLMKQVSTLWAQEDKRKRLRAQGDDVMRQLKGISKTVSDEIADARNADNVYFQQSSSSSAGIDVLKAMEQIYQHWKEDYDPRFGGFGEEPKVRRGVLLRQIKLTFLAVSLTIFDFRASASLCRLLRR